MLKCQGNCPIGVCQDGCGALHEGSLVKEVSAEDLGNALDYFQAGWTEIGPKSEGIFEVQNVRNDV